jgi:hypothetical protein
MANDSSINTPIKQGIHDRPSERSAKRKAPAFSRGL